MYVLTGSEQFKLSEAIGQSLAGRTALLRLLPLTLSERMAGGGSDVVEEMIFGGFYPRILDQSLEPRQALGDYFETYVERDVRRLGGIRNLSAFRLFLRLCAGRVGQLINLSSLGSDAGVSHTTAREWLTIAEASYIVFQLPAYHANIRKRLVRSPKLYFHDVGLAAYLLGIESPDQVATHPLRGALFENVVVAEALKYGFNRGMRPNLSFYRDSKGLECDLLYETSRGISAIEAKSGLTVASSYFSSINQLAELLPAISKKTVVYGGALRQMRSDCQVLPLAEFAGSLERFDVEQDVAAFLQEQRGPEPKESDVGKLDALHSLQVRPILEALDPVCRKLGSELFRRFWVGDWAAWGTTSVQSIGLLAANSWEHTKAKHLLDRGFTLEDARPVELTRQYDFSGYTGISGQDFALQLIVKWKLGRDSFSRLIFLNGNRMPGSKDAIAYGGLAESGSDVDKVVAQVLRSLLDEIASRSGR